MKTSNKLLIAAFVVIVIIMLTMTLTVKREMNKAGIMQNQNSIEQNDSISNDSSSININ